MSKTTLGKVCVTPGGAWSSASEYAKLTVVTNAGGAYLSKKTVPAGTALSSTEYWLQITEKGDTGKGITSIAKTGTSGSVDTYTITYTDGTTTTFTVTNGSVTSVNGRTGAVTGLQEDMSLTIVDGALNITYEE